MDKYTANVIAENMFVHVDDGVNQYLLMNNITDHRKDNKAIPIYDGMTRSHNGNESLKITTRGWELLVEWKYGSTSWMKLKDMKESIPIEVAEYAVASRIVEETAFKMVGGSHDTQREPDHLKSQDLVLANHAQVWYQVEQDDRRSAVVLKNCGD